MKFIIFIITFYILFITCDLLSQPSITWQGLYNGPSNRDDEANAICLADSNNIYLAGYTFFTSSPSYRPYVIKINQYGDTLWTRIILINGGGGFVNALLPTTDGGCIATGEKSNLKFLFRLDKFGNTIWVYTYPGDAIFYDIERALNGDYICSGLNNQGGAALRIDTLGNIKFDKKYPNSFFQWHSLLTTGDNGCLVAGIANQQAVITRLDSNGNVTGTKSFSVNNSPTLALSLERDSSKNYVLSGNYWNGTTDVPYFIKLDLNLNPLDTHIFSQVNQEIEHSMKVLPSGKYVWTFEELGMNRLLITNENGNILYEKVKNYNSNQASEEFYDIHPLTNGDIIFIGYASYISFDDMFAVRTDSALNFPPNIIGIQQINDVIPNKFQLFQNYPNPFNPMTKIKFQIPNYSHVKITIFDLLGKEIKVLVNESLNTGVYETQWNAINYSSGLYFYKLEAENFVETKKMILTK